MGASCARVDCVVTVEECTRQAQSFGSSRPKAFWQHCAGSQSYSPGANSPRNSGFEDAASLSKGQELEAEAQLSFDQFAVHHCSSGSSGGPISSWRRRYILGRELGTGQTATVFEAFATAPGIKENDESWYMRSPRADELSGQWPGGDSSGSSPSRPSSGTPGRRVALKRFHQEGTMIFKQELKALLAVGVHPHVVRLLESFEASGEDDVIVLEHCDGGDVYELYATNNGCCMLESFVRQLIRQLLLALQHLQERCIEHRDVKPENLLLFTTSMNGKSVPFLKLADFGWATIVNKLEPEPALPPEGVGSLWYAPPELNPPVKGMEIFVDEFQLGKSDIWSVGIITYLLLIGHSPFNVALRVKDPVAREAEVMRLAALGDVNTSSKVWKSILSEEARSFVLALIRPDPAKRLSPAEALGHPFMTMLSPEEQVDAGIHGQIEPPFPTDNEGSKWQRLDSLQKLCWLALARAATEPELVEVSLLQAFVHDQGSGSAGYLERLAAKLVAVSSPSWFHPQAAWGDMLYLAFLYLDRNGDGFLSVDDLMVHFAGGTHGRELADLCIFKWRSNGQQALPLGASHSLSLADFRRVLFSSIADLATVDSVAPPAGAGAIDSRSEALIQNRMNAIEQVCSRFLEEEFENSGAGL
eukprot:TRINITY_DN24989_c0_g1_i1.p1 TRINITY_DN24989_c0_g1~~TRINITY_DN24989_c0_g1_i1.p1  ORF type:complete len:656 (-),score=86.87 TRINITY_DN24989_c0_g1_i1:93-2024(-)